MYIMPQQAGTEHVRWCPRFSRFRGGRNGRTTRPGCASSFARRARLRRARRYASCSPAMRHEPAARGPAGCARSLRQPAAAAPAATAQTAAPKSGKRKSAARVLGALLAVAGVYYGVNYYLVGRFIVSTDDAYVRASNTTLGARGIGPRRADPAGRQRRSVKRRRGDLQDRRRRLSASRSMPPARKIATQQATIDRIGRQVARAGKRWSSRPRRSSPSAQAAAEARRARIRASARALSTRGLCLARGLRSLAGQIATRARQPCKAAEAAVHAAEQRRSDQGAAERSARAQLDGIPDLAGQGRARSRISPVQRAGRWHLLQPPRSTPAISSRPGQRLANVVPLDDVYHRRQLQGDAAARMQSGPARVSVERRCRSQPRHRRRRWRASPPAAGSVFTLLPPDNATGNFTKIVQRVPVRIQRAG